MITATKSSAGSENHRRALRRVAATDENHAEATKYTRAGLAWRATAHAAQHPRIDS